MDFNAFSHGQMHSKLWLCDNLEPYMPKGANVIVIGSWYNLMGLLLLSRNNNYNSIKGIDIDASAISIANQLCQSWMIQPDLKIYNEVADANTYDYNGYQVFINCSVEHINTNEWYQRIPKGFLVCLQSSDVNNNDPVWDIRNPNNTIDEFAGKYPLTHTLYRGSKLFTYNNFSYNRFMIIGLK
jgi:hypothetical protein